MALAEALKDTDPEETPFEEYEEEAILSLILDHPEFFASIVKYLEISLFSKAEAQYLIAHILHYYEQYGVLPTRGMLLSIIKRDLTVDSPGWEEIIGLAERESDERDVPAIKGRLLEWARVKAYGLLYDPDTIARYQHGDYDYMEEILHKANAIQHTGSNVLWFLDEVHRLFGDETLDHFTTGFPRLDAILNNGGPVRGEMLVWMAPTGKGKSITLVNNAVANLLRKRNVLYVTMEMSSVASAVRALGVVTSLPVNKRTQPNIKKQMVDIVAHLSRSGDIGRLGFVEYPPDEVSVDMIYAKLDDLRRNYRWVPDVIILDYLELMVSRRGSDNREDYTRQKNVSTQVRGLAKNANVMLFTATQTNRSGNDSTSVIDVTKIAESYGKSMALDYLISINQSTEEYEEQFDDPNSVNRAPIRPASARLYIAKSRTSGHGQTVPVRVNYLTYAMKEMT